VGLRFGAFPLARHGVPFGLLSTVQRESNGSHEFSAHPLAFPHRNEQERERRLICARIAPVSRALRCPATPARVFRASRQPPRRSPTRRAALRRPDRSPPALRRPPAAGPVSPALRCPLPGGVEPSCNR
jgi:hypothetical protein